MGRFVAIYNPLMYVKGVKHLSITSTYLQPVFVESHGSPKSSEFSLLFRAVSSTNVKSTENESVYIYAIKRYMIYMKHYMKQINSNESKDP